MVIVLSLRCENPVENWLCLCCKEVLCSRFVNRHMLMHHQQTGHCLALSYRYIYAFSFSLHLLFFCLNLTVTLWIDKWLVRVVLLLRSVSRCSDHITAETNSPGCLLSQIWRGSSFTPTLNTKEHSFSYFCLYGCVKEEENMGNTEFLLYFGSMIES